LEYGEWKQEYWQWEREEKYERNITEQGYMMGGK